MPDTKYRFRVVAHNSYGQGESSAALKVATQAEVPGPAPNLQTVSNTPTSVSLSWDKPLTGNGEILSYKLYYTDTSVGTEEVGPSLSSTLQTVQVWISLSSLLDLKRAPHLQSKKGCC
ncbi:hypothetical protein GOODEAATRI_002828 [Goodea atripinnis]|uniref:Fibronectin type-III domain-containing protein n=1 Tax=Goodea atripinnis TaxID=208336 RepID=A0ABV0NRA1_9TELE